jgi:hypothetical protein
VFWGRVFLWLVKRRCESCLLVNCVFGIRLVGFGRRLVDFVFFFFGLTAVVLCT